LNKFQRNNRRHQKIRKPMRMARPSVNDWLTPMLGNLLLDCDSFHAGRQWRPSYVCTRNLRWFYLVAVSQEGTAGYTPSISSTPLTVKKPMHVEYVNESGLFIG
jgi:hypothetical protein